MAEQSIQRKAVVYDGDGDAHYDTISAFIKSMRGSDVDATLYWLAKMIHAGEDPRFISRRIVICAAEDVGLADPMALVLANAANQAAEFVGWPEARIPIAEAAIYIATAHKSNSSITGIDAALADVRSGRTLAVPEHLRDGHYAGAKKLGHGVGYQYAHDQPDHFAAQDYLGTTKHYYEPTEQGWKRRSRNGWKNGARCWPRRGNRRLEFINRGKNPVAKGIARANQWMTAVERANASEKIRQHLEQQTLWKSARAILFYAPLAEEPDIWALFEDSLAAGKRVFLPRFHEETGHYRAVEIKNAAEDLMVGRFGIREPKAECAEISLKQLDLILVPGLGFTLDGRRLGRGKGYYDRLLAEASSVICGVAFDEQIADALPLEAHDKKVDCLVTPTGGGR